MKQKREEKQEEQKKIVDVSLLTNDQLRPWTMDPALEEKLSMQMENLEQTISFTSPQKNGGNRGDSILDIPSTSHIEFQKTIRQNIHNDPVFQQTFERRFEPFTSTLKGINIWNTANIDNGRNGKASSKGNVHKNNKSAGQPYTGNRGNKSDNGSEKGVPQSTSEPINESMGLFLPVLAVPESRSSFNFPSSPSPSSPFNNSIDMRTGSGDVEGRAGPEQSSHPHHSHYDDDIRYIEKLQKKLRTKTQKVQSMERPSTTGTVSAVHYQPVRSPAVIPMRMREYEILKASVNASPSHRQEVGGHMVLTVDAQNHHHGHGDIEMEASHPEKINQSPSTATSTYKYLQALKHRPRNHHSGGHTGDRIHDMSRSYSQGAVGMGSPHLSILGLPFESTMTTMSPTRGGKFQSLSELSPMRTTHHDLAVTSNDKNLMVSKSSPSQKQSLSPVKSPPRLILSMKSVPQSTH